MVLLKIMKILAAGDAWFNDRVEALLKWLEEWFSISQKWAERGMMAVYVALILIPPSWSVSWISAKTAVAFLIVGPMWILHRKPEAARGLMLRYPLFSVVRTVLCMFVVFLGISCLADTPYEFSKDAIGISQFVYVVFFYMTDISSKGERGRKRKLALEELKKLFGVEWIPKPVNVPG